MKYFTKEYIELCKDEKIQNLRGNEWEMGDFMHYKSGEIDVMHPKLDNGTPIWLPTGDQLDEEIIKVLKNNKNLDYKFTRQGMTKEYYAEITNYKIYTGYHIIHSKNNINPLVAKIKLLLELLESEEK